MSKNHRLPTFDQAGLLKSAMWLQPRTAPGWRSNPGSSDCLLKTPTPRAVDFHFSAGGESPFFLESPVSIGYAFPWVAVTVKTPDYFDS